MFSDRSLDSAQRTVRMWTIGLTVWFLLSFAMYGAGYNHGLPEGWFTWEYWKYFVTLLVIPIILVVTLLFAYDASFGDGRIRGTFHFWATFAAFLWLLQFGVWEIIAITQCDDISGTKAKHPHCRNREYPDPTFKDIPDTAFLLTFAGAALAWIGSIMTLYWSNQLVCAAMATRNVDVAGLNYESQIRESIGGPTNFSDDQIGLDLNQYVGGIADARLSNNQHYHF